MDLVVRGFPFRVGHLSSQVAGYSVAPRLLILQDTNYSKRHDHVSFHTPLFYNSKAFKFLCQINLPYKNPNGTLNLLLNEARDFLNLVTIIKDLEIYYH